MIRRKESLPVLLHVSCLLVLSTQAQTNCGDAPPCNRSDIFPVGAPDCRVDLSDLGQLLTNFTGGTADCGKRREDGDIVTGDGCVNLGDLGQMLADFGARCEDFEPQPIWPGQIFSVANFGSPDRLAAGDVNGDGHADVVFSTYERQSCLRMAPGRGDGTIGPVVGLPPVIHPGYVRLIGVADMNGDGAQDVVARIHDFANGTPAVIVVMNENGMPSRAVFTGPVATRTTCGTVGDFNGDSFPDIALGINLQQIAIATNHGDGTFGTPQFLNINALALAAGDLNQDGQDDLVAVTESPPQMIILRNVGGTFPTQEVFPLIRTRGLLLEIADINRDGRPDIILDQQFAFMSEYVTVFRNGGSGTFHSGASYKIRYAPAAMHLGDMNGDGFPDVAYAIEWTAGRLNSVDLLLNNKAGGFSEEGEYPGWQGVLTTGDFNENGTDDVVVANTPASVVPH